MILGVYGFHNSGKTALVVKLTEGLVSRGYSVATIKHIPREFSVDAEGKDTWRHKKAGAGIVVASSLNETTFIFNRHLGLDEIMSRLGGYDVILVEGCKKSSIQKIAVGDIKEEENTILRYNGNLGEIIDFVERGVKMEENRRITVEVDGKKIPMNRFVQEIFVNTIGGMVSSLKGVENPRDVKIEVRL